MSLARRFPLALAGLLLAALAIAVLASASPHGTSAAAIVVTNTNDSGAGSLRQAITDANTNAVPDSISFNIPVCPPACTISLASGLPELTDDETTINGTTQPGYAETPLVVLDGSGAGAFAYGIRTESGSEAQTVLGLAFQDFWSGIGLCTSNGSTAERNLVSGSELDGIIACGEDIALIGNVVEGSGRYGINAQAGAGAPGVLIDDNVLTGGSDSGVRVHGDGATIKNNTVTGNTGDGIVAAYGDADVSIEHNEVTENGGFGITLSGSGAVAKDNVVTGNSRSGMYIGGESGEEGGTVTGNVVMDNGGAGSSPDGRAGISLWGSAGATLFGNEVSGSAGDGVHVAGSFVTIGGAGPGEANTITGNGGAGIYLPGAGEIYAVGPAGAGLDFDPTDNTFSGNSIHGNGGLGIDLAPEGITPNDVLDSDTGPNRHQNFPVLAAASTGNSLTVTGSLNSRSEGQFRIEFFANDACDEPSGQGEGQEYLGAVDVTTDVQGNAAISVVLPVDVDSGRFITATATHPSTGDTSEFSNCVEVDAPAGTPTPTATPAPGTPTPTATPTPTPEPSPTGTPSGEAKGGDVDCDEDVDSVDALKVLRHVAGLEVSQEEPCPDIGTEVASLFGDIDCDDDVDSVDALRILRYVAGLPNDLPGGCPAVGV